MQKERDPQRAEDKTDTAHGSREEEATSSETLSDVEKTERVSNKTGSRPGADESTDSAAPSPDGQFDADRTGQDEAGPM